MEFICSEHWSSFFVLFFSPIRPNSSTGRKNSDFVTFVWTSIQTCSVSSKTRGLSSWLEELCKFVIRLILLSLCFRRPRGYISSVLKASCGVENVVEKQFGHVIPASNLLPVVVCKLVHVFRLISFFQPGMCRTILWAWKSVRLMIPFWIYTHVRLTSCSSIFRMAVLFSFRTTIWSCHLKSCLLHWNPRSSRCQFSTRFMFIFGLFTEKRGQDPEELIRRYSQAARNSRSGAVLLASASGRLSEGINFADNMARAVVMVGLPYPNAMDVETKLRASVRSYYLWITASYSISARSWATTLFKHPRLSVAVLHENCGSVCRISHWLSHWILL